MTKKTKKTKKIVPPDAGWVEVDERGHTCGRSAYVHSVHVKRVGPLTHIATVVDDESPDLSHLGEYTDRNPDYPYFDRVADVLVVGVENIEVTKVELWRRNPHDRPCGDVQAGCYSYVAEREIPHGGTVAEAEAWLLEHEWTPKGYAAAGLEPEFREDTEQSDRYIAYDYSKSTEVIDGQRVEVITPFLTSYDPEDHYSSGREYRYVHAFQNPCELKDGVANLDEVKACICDARRLGNHGDDWTSVGVRMVTKIGADENGLGGEEVDVVGNQMESLWGIESDSDAAHFEEVREELLPDPADVLKSLEETLAATAKRVETLKAYIDTLKAQV